MATSSTELAAFAKTVFTTPVIEKVAMVDQPFLAMIKKTTTEMNEVGLHVPLLTEEQAGSSATFSQAQTNAATGYMRNAKFLVTPVNNYEVARMNGRAVRALKGDKRSYFDAWRRTIESAFINLTRVLGQNLLGVRQYGSLGVVGTTATTLITLATREDIVNFAVGDVLVSADTESSDTLHSGGATLAITAVDHDAGTITLASTIASTWSETAAGDHLFRAGDRQDSGSPTAIMMASVLDYCPPTAPSTTLFGLTRTGNSRLSGGRYDGSGLPIREAIIRGTSRARAQGARPDICIVNEEDFAELTVELATSIRYTDIVAGSKGQLTFSAVQLPNGIKVVPDVNQKKGYALLLMMSTWELSTIGAAPGLLDDDGQEFLRVTDADAYEVRTGYYGNLICRAPAWNYNITLPTT